MKKLLKPGRIMLVCLGLLFAVSATAWAVNYYAPWAPGQSRYCTQGNNDIYSHLPGTSNAWAWDFGLNYEDVLASAAGTIEETSWDSYGGGNYIKLRHADGYVTRYAHLNAFYVSVGQVVPQGYAIAQSGSSGNSTGPHLHFQRDPGDWWSVQSSFTDIGVPVRDGYYTSGNRVGPKPKPCVGNNADGRLEVFARGRDGAIWHAAVMSGGGWSNWMSLGGGFKGDPVVTNNADGRMEVFCVAGNGRLQHAYQTSPNGGWYSWGDELAGNWPADPALAKQPDGRIEIFMIGTSGYLYHRWQLVPSGSWSSSWNTFDSKTFKQIAPTAVTDNSGYPHVFAVGTDGAIYHKWCSASGWSAGWQNLGGNWNISPSAVVNTDGRLEIFAVGTDGKMNHKWQNTPGGTWSNWDSSLGGGWNRIPVMGQNQSGNWQVFCTGQTGPLFTKWWDGAYWQPTSGWQDLGGGWSGDAGIGRNPDGRLELFMIGSDPYMYHKWQTSANGTWTSGWATIGPNTIF